MFIDHCLPFGLCSAPKIFTAFADALAWILYHCGIHHIMHYLDDFMFFGSLGSGEASSALRLACRLLADLGIPVSLPKLEGPSTTVTFLGIVIDSERMELRLPQEKVERIRAMVSCWLGRRSCRCSEPLAISPMQQLWCGLAGFSCITFSLSWRRLMYDMILSIWMVDLAWWDCFLQSWHGLLLLSLVVVLRCMFTRMRLGVLVVVLSQAMAGGCKSLGQSLGLM